MQPRRGRSPEKRGEQPDGPRVARIIAVANQKGGVGKSTTAVSLGAALAELGHHVLVVDLDPQGNASTGLGIRHEAREVTVYDVLASDAPISDAIVPTPLENLFAVPSTIDLAGAEIELVSQFSRELRLRKAIEPLKRDSYDFVFLDCPPSLGLLTVNALAAAEELLVPIQCEYYALEGLGQLLRNVRLVQQNVNTSLRLTGIVMTMFDPRTKLSEQVVAEVRRYFGDRVYRTIIPRTVRLSEAPGFGQPITVYDPSSKGAQSYRELALEVAARLPDDGPLPMVDDVPTVNVPPPEAQPARAPRPLVGPEDEVQAFSDQAPGREGPGPGPEEPRPPREPEGAGPDTLEEPGAGRPASTETAAERHLTLEDGSILDGESNSGDETGTPPGEPESEPESEAPSSRDGGLRVDAPRSDWDGEPEDETAPQDAGAAQEAGSLPQREGRWRRGLFRRGGSR